MCPICSLRGRRNLSKVRSDLSKTLSSIDINKLEPETRTLLHEFRSSAALLFSDVDAQTSDFTAGDACNLTKLISDLKAVACIGITNVSRSNIHWSRLADNLDDLNREIVHLVETVPPRALSRFICKEDTSWGMSNIAKQNFRSQEVG